MFPSRFFLSRCLRRFRQGFALIVSAVLFCPPPFLLAEVTAAGPDWWAEQGVLASGTAADDYAAINQGQLKNLATKAAQAMEAKLSGGAGAAVWNMINGWSALQNGTRTPTPGDLTDDYATVTLGQVKAVAKPFYDRLIADGKAIGYPWDGTWPADDYAVANIGQTKYLFSFTLPTQEGPVDSDGDGIPDYWENLLGSDPNNPHDADIDPNGTGFTYRDRYEELVNGRADPATSVLNRPKLFILTPTL